MRAASKLLPSPPLHRVEWSAIERIGYDGYMDYVDADGTSITKPHQIQNSACFLVHNGFFWAIFDLHCQVAKENGKEHDCKVGHIFQWMRQSIDDHVQALIGLEGPKTCRRFVMLTQTWPAKYSFGCGVLNIMAGGWSESLLAKMLEEFQHQYEQIKDCDLREFWQAKQTKGFWECLGYYSAIIMLLMFLCLGHWQGGQIHSKLIRPHAQVMLEELRQRMSDTKTLQPHWSHQKSGIKLSSPLKLF